MSGSEELAKRKQHEALAVPGAKRPNDGQVKESSKEETESVNFLDFSTDLLKIYYERLFPYKQMFRWLSYKNDPKAAIKSSKMDRDFFLKREFVFVLDGDIFCRYQCFPGAEEFREKVVEAQPVRMEIGPVYNHPPRNHGMMLKDAFRPIERELVFDIDMDEYDDVRTCCSGAKICLKCWTFVRTAIRTLDAALREDFGFKHILFVYSGRRGVHCWVCDPAARKLLNDQRSAVAEYMNLQNTANSKFKVRMDFGFADDLHPSVKRAYEICSTYFLEEKTGILDGQDLFRQGENLENLKTELLRGDEPEKLTKFLKMNPDVSSRRIWKKIEEFANDRITKEDKEWKQKEMKNFVLEIVLNYCYPRLDINVSKSMNHLLKSPFVVHPKTGRICVPIDPADVDSFNPLEVPTLGKIVQELNAGDTKTSLWKYTQFFENKFLKPLEAEMAREMDPMGW